MVNYKEILKLTIPVQADSDGVIFYLFFTVEKFKKDDNSTDTQLEITMQTELNPELQAEPSTNTYFF